MCGMQGGLQPRGAVHIGYPSETHLKLKSRKISFANNIRFNRPILLKFCTEHGSITAMLFEKLQNDWTTGADVMNGGDFARFEFKMSFGRISYIAQHSRDVVEDSLSASVTSLWFIRGSSSPFRHGGVVEDMGLCGPLKYRRCSWSPSSNYISFVQSMWGLA